MAQSLAEVKIFQPLPKEALEALAQRGQHRRYPAGGVLMRQGDPGTSLHVVLSGRVRVERSSAGASPVVLVELGPNEVVGELGVLDHAPRSATVTATGDTETLELDSIALAGVIVQHPAVAVTLLRALSKRLRTAGDLIEQLSRESR